MTNFDKFSYNGNYCVFQHGVPNALFGSGARPSRTLATIRLPASQNCFFDGRLLCNFDSPFFDPGNPASPANQLPPRHSEGVNVSFVDGHSKYQKARLSAPTGKNGGFWEIAGGPFDGRLSLWGLVGDDDKYAGCPN